MGVLTRSEMLQLNMFQSRFKHQSSIISVLAFVNFVSHSELKACFICSDLCSLKAYTISMVANIGKLSGEA